VEWSEWVGELDNRRDSVVVTRCYEKLVAEAGDRLGTQKKGNVCRWKQLPSDDQ
jgi:hypothetical protein